MPVLATPNIDEREQRCVERRSKVAYIVSRFPKLTETFILYEMLAVEDGGLQIELYSLQREKTSVMHPEAAAYVRRAHFQPFLSWAILRAHLFFLWRKPRAYFKALTELLRRTYGSARYFFAAIAFFPKMVYFARQMSADGVEHLHAHFASHPAAAAFVIHHLTGIPYSFTAHGSDLHRERRMLREKVSAAAFVVSISGYNRRVIFDECGPQVAGNVVVIHCGVDTLQLQPSDAQHAGSASDPFAILCIGTLHEVKGQTHLIEACRLLHQRRVAFQLHFVGDGPDLSALQQQSERAQIASHVTFHGRKNRTQVIEHLRTADVLAAPSVPSKDGRREGIPVVLMEAMSCGLPVVASDLSGIPELVEHATHGFLVRPGDTCALADALERLSGDPELRRRFGSVGRTRIIDEFDIRTNAGLLVDRFRSVTQKRQPPSDQLEPRTCSVPTKSPS